MAKITNFIYLTDKKYAKIKKLKKIKKHIDFYSKM